MWLQRKSKKAYLSRKGNPDNVNAHWFIDGL